MDLTTQNIRTMGRGFSRLFQEGRGSVAPWYTRLATVVPSTTAENVYGWMIKLPKMRKWVGDRVIHNVASQDYVVKNDDFELTVSVPRNSVMDDTFGIYNPIASELGQQASKYPDDLLVTLMQSGQSLVGPDGQFFFDVDHPISPINATMGTQSNYLVSSAFSEATFDTALATMAGFVGEDGRPMGVTPNLLVVPPQLRFAANKVVARDLTTNGESNVYKGATDVLVIPELVNKPTEWYLFDTTRALKPFIFQNRMSPQFVPLTAVNDENVFMHKEYIWGVDARGAAAFGLWFLGLKATAAAS